MAVLKTFKAHYAKSSIERIKTRATDLGDIHHAKTQLGLTENEYRDMVSAASSGASRSAGELSAVLRKKLIKALVKRGYVKPENESPRQKELRAKRLTDLALIHMGARALSLGTDPYKKMVKQASAGKSMTAALLLSPERAKLLAAMKAEGFDLGAARVACLA